MIFKNTIRAYFDKLLNNTLYYLYSYFGNYRLLFLFNSNIIPHNNIYIINILYLIS